MAVWGILLLVSTAGRPHPLGAQQTPELGADEPLVDEVVIRGVRTLNAGELEESLTTRPTQCRSLLFQPFCWVSDRGFFHDRYRLDLEELSRDELRIRVFHWLRGFRSARATSEVDEADDGVSVRFDVDEGPPVLVRSLEVLQDPALLTDAAVARARLPQTGQPLDLIRLEMGVDSLRGSLQEAGYANAIVADSVVIDSTASESVSDTSTSGLAREAPQETPLADVTIRIRPGRLVTVDSIVVEGNRDVTDETILRSLALSPGDPYRRSALEDAQRRLYRSNLFRQSIVTTLEGSPELARTVEDGGPTEEAATAPAAGDVPEPQPGDTTRTVLVVVREAPFDEVGLGLGFTTFQFGQLQGRYARYNFLGGGRILSLQTNVGNLLAPQLYDEPLFEDALPQGVAGTVESPFLDPTWSVSAEFTQPWFYSSRSSLGLDAFYRRRAVAGVVVDRSYGGSVTFSRQLSSNLLGSARYRFEKNQVDAGGIYFCVNFGICENRIIDALQRVHRLSPLTFTLNMERVDDVAAPRQGYTVRLDAEHASSFTASDYRYNTASIEGTLYRPFGSGVIAAHVRMGWVRSLSSTNEALGVARAGTSLLHPRKRLYAGGSRSVRGYGENQLGPRVLTVAASRLTNGDPETEDPEGPECSTAEIDTGNCDPNPLPSSAFQPRPLGGNEVVEASIEYRFPLVGNLSGAVFLDAGYVGDLNLNIPSGARAAATPGFGLRYLSPIGLIRADLGIRPRLVERLPVVTALPGEEDRALEPLETMKRYDPVGTTGGLWEEVIRRMILHLSIGQPF